MNRSTFLPCFTLLILAFQYTTTISFLNVPKAVPRIPTTLSVLGFFKKDESNESETPDEEVNDGLESVGKTMESMSRFKTSRKVGDRASTILQELSNLNVEGVSADGKVRVTYDGQQYPVSVQIDEGYFQSLDRKSGTEELNRALVSAMKQAHEKSMVKMEEKMKALYFDLGFDTSL